MAVFFIWARQVQAAVESITNFMNLASLVKAHYIIAHLSTRDDLQFSLYTIKLIYYKCLRSCESKTSFKLVVYLQEFNVFIIFLSSYMLVFKSYKSYVRLNC